MRLEKFHLPTFALLAAFGALAYFTQVSLDPKNKPPELMDNYAPPKNIEHFAFGFHENMADMLWIRSLQDAMYCEIKKDKRNCQDMSWFYGMMDAVTDLSPYFYIAYLLGGVQLSVVISDIEGARKIYDKGVLKFPNDWYLNFHAGAHYMIEEKNNVRAAELIHQAARAGGGPPWLFSLASTLYTKEGQKVMAQKVLDSLKESKLNKEQMDEILKKYQDLVN